MTRALLFLLLLLVSGIPTAHSGPRKQDSREQTNFGVEDSFEKPVSIPVDALQSLRMSKHDDDLLQDCAEQEGIRPAEIPASWFTASELRLRQAPASGLVVRGERPCFRGAHIVQVWVLAKSVTGYRVVFRGRVDGLAVLPTRTNGYRDLQLIIVTQAAAYISYVTFRYADGEYRLSGQRTEHSN